MSQELSAKSNMKIVSESLQKLVQEKSIFFHLFQNRPLAKEEFLSFFDKDTRTIMEECIKKSFRGEEGEIKSLWLGNNPIERIIFFGLGEQEKWNSRKLPLLMRRMVQYAKRERIESIATPLFIPQDTEINYATKIHAENALMATFEYLKYKETPKEGWPVVKQITFGVSGDGIVQKQAERGIAEGVIIGEEINLCRDLVNTPGSDMTPTKLAVAAAATAKRTGMTAKILDKRKMAKLGMGGVLGVARGSDEEPKFIILEYKRGPKNQPPLVLAGKGVTFDTGGLNIKPDQHMYEMHMDMSGGAAVIFGMAAIARLKLPINVIGLVPAVENMPSGSSYRPGDLLKALNGKTIEILNTDAEGRVILADALSYGQRYNPGLMIDFATLTGAAHVALGHYTSALFTKDEIVQQKLYEIGQRADDYVWPLPLWDEYLADIKGTFGDFTNIGKHDRYGGAIHGAKFLEQFTGDTCWAHLDIAPRMTTVESDFLAKGASGVGVRFIIELAHAYPLA